MTNSQTTPATPAKDIDAIVCGSCVVDILVRPVPLETPIGGGKLFTTDPISLTTGGIVSNSGAAFARLGMKAAAFSYVGDDEWAPVIRAKYAAENLDASHLITHPTGSTSNTAVLIDTTGERSFAHCVGAPKLMNAQTFLDNIDFLARARMILVGYYSLMPNLESDLPHVFAELRKRGCQTALDAAGEGGGISPLDKILPHLDVYVPSIDEAMHQTGESDPQKIIDIYRSLGAPGVLGVKLGSDGALLSPAADEYIKIDCITAPSPVIDTTGAGDSFYAGLLTGLLKNLPLEQAGKLGAATGACCVTKLGATNGLRGYNDTATLAGI